jgi:hypothetical protein
VARNNIFKNNNIDVGMAGYDAGTNFNEICFNFSEGNTYSTVYVNSSGTVGTNHIYRNTLIGSLLFRIVDSGDGPIYINNNVIINNDNHSSTTPHIRENVGEYYTITAEIAEVTDNLTGGTTDGIVDESGYLLNSEYVGTYGWETGETPATTATIQRATSGAPVVERSAGGPEVQ